MTHHQAGAAESDEAVPLADRPEALAMFDHLLRQLLVAEPCRAELAALWLEPWRRYHGAGHAGLLWQRHLALGGDPGDAVTAHAIAYHDAIYAVGARDNELRSAALWHRHAANLPVALREGVSTAILATADHAAWHAPEAARWLVDLDLTPLGEPWELFMANTRALREEAGTAPAVTQPEQRAFLGRLLALPMIYRSDRAACALRPAYEETARRNLSRLLSG